MPNRDEPVFSSQDIAWVDVIEENLGKRAEVGIVGDLVIGKPRYLDGYSFSWCAMAQRFRVGDLMEALQEAGSIKELERLRGEYSDEDELVEMASPAFALLLSFPDWPSEDAVTYVLPLHDADHFLLQLQDTVREARKKQGSYVATILRDVRASLQDDKRTRCSYPKCRKHRSFFDQQGNGYCKRHAEELGLRPRGKVT